MGSYPSLSLFPLARAVKARALPSPRSESSILPPGPCAQRFPTRDPRGLRTGPAVHRRRHFRHLRSRTAPFALYRNPLATLSFDPQYGHLNGLAIFTSPQEPRKSRGFICFAVAASLKKLLWSCPAELPARRVP